MNARRSPQKPRRTTGIRYADLDPELVAKMKGPAPNSAFIADGCTAAPDSVGPVDILPACFFHDWSYMLGGTEKDRKRADARLWRNIRTCGGSWWLAFWYWIEVRAYGFDHFGYIGKPPGRWFRWWTICVARFGVFFAE